jgi:hypothetical protein
MLPAILLIAGASLAVVLIRMARRRGPVGQLRIYAVGLLIAALIYVVFAALGGAPVRWLALETAGVVGFGVLAWIGVQRSAAFLAAGWAAHVLWDILLHLGIAAGARWTPMFYPWLCLSFDLVIAGAILLRPRRFARAA